MKRVQIVSIFIMILLLAGCSKPLPENVKDCGEPHKGEWTIVWCDEFNYTGKPDDTKWGYDIGGHGWGNQELQYYTDREENAYVKDGHLTIATIKESFGANPYTSARLVTKNKAEWLYGRIDVKARVPKGKGTWSAIWMLPTDWKYGGWPDSGEIDIMEHVGYNENMIYGTIHTGKYNHGLGTQIGANIRINDATSAYHVYSVEWNPRELIFMVDDNVYKIIKFNEAQDSGSEYYMAWPFDQRFHLILNIAMGGSWGGAQGIDPNLTYTDMSIDYVRVYQKDLAYNDVKAPTVPQINQTNTIVSSRTATISWAPSEDNLYVKHYEVYLNNQLVDTSFSSKYILEGLEPNKDYVVQIKAVDFANNKSNSATLNIKTLPLPTVPGRIEAENFDYISNGKLRASTDVDGDKVVEGIRKNDYLVYTFNALEAGEYTLKLRLSSFLADNKVAVYTVDSEGNTILYYSLTDIPRTGGYNNWETVIFARPINLVEGMNTIKIYSRSNNLGDNFWLNWIELEKNE